MKWKEFSLEQVTNYCNEIGQRTFSLREFRDSKIDAFRGFKPDNENIDAKIRQQLQFLRNAGHVTFVDNSGNYTLRSTEFLESEKEDLQNIDLQYEEPEKREHLFETYVRKATWAVKAKETLGEYCLCNDCKNTFIKKDGKRYIEVHHIIPLHDGGENALWNLSVLCAHHHRMAHFADTATKNKLRNYLLRENRAKQ